MCHPCTVLGYVDDYFFHKAIHLVFLRVANSSVSYVRICCNGKFNLHFDNPIVFMATNFGSKNPHAQQ